MSARYQDYYQILGVERSASADDIQRAYRGLARKFHPDVNKEASADKRFKEINEAYEVLKDAEKRKLYDQLGANWKQGQEFRPPPGWSGGGRGGRGRGQPQGAGADFSEFFESIFGGRGAGGFGGFSNDDFVEAMRSGSRATRNRARQGESHEVDVTVSLSDVYHKATRTISLTMTDEDGDQATKSFDVKLPAGITDGATIRLSGQGGEGSGGGSAGDLLLRIHISSDPRFRIDPSTKHDLITSVRVSPWEAALGAKVPVATMDGEVTVTVPPGTQSGQKLRIRGKGLPKKGGEHADLLAEIRIVVPRILSAEERELLERLSEVSNFDPRTA